MPIPRRVGQWNKVGLNRRGIRPGERQILRVIGVADFMALKTASTAGPGTGPSSAAHRG